MKYLLDVNALIAWRHTHHSKSGVFHAWAARTGVDNMFTCSHTELGFLRISMQLGLTSAEATASLEIIREQIGGYVADNPRPRLARWVLSHKQTTDSYLCQFADAHGMQLATFDSGIKDNAAYLIS